MSLTKFLLGIVILFVILMFFVVIFSSHDPPAKMPATKTIEIK